MNSAMLSFGNLVSIIAAAAAKGTGFEKLVMGLTFPLGLMMILLSEMDLFTGNVFYMTFGVLDRRVSIKHLVVTWTMSYFSNFAGSLFVGSFLVFLPRLLDPVALDYLISLVTKKCSYQFHENLIRGVGCNWLVCTALFQAYMAKDVPGKAIGAYLPIFAFIMIGFEHCVANMFSLPLGLMYGAPVSVG